MCVHVCACVCVCVWVCLCVCVCVCVCVFVCERGCVFVKWSFSGQSLPCPSDVAPRIICGCVWEREGRGGSVCVWVCLCVWERERVRERVKWSCFSQPLPCPSNFAPRIIGVCVCMFVLCVCVCVCVCLCVCVSNKLQHTASRCNTLQHTATLCHLGRCPSRHLSTHCNTLQHTATHCSTLSTYFICCKKLGRRTSSHLTVCWSVL